MENNNALETTETRDAEIILRARLKVKDMHERYARKGGWRRVQTRLKLPNVSIAFNFCKNGTVPKNKDHRRALGLPRRLPSERPIRKPRAIVKIGQPGWEQKYFRKVKP